MKGQALLAIALLGTCAARAQAPVPKPPPCSAPEFRQLDFWIGDWDLTWPGGSGTNHVVRTLGDCVIEENFSGSGTPPLLGHSVSTYSARLKQWAQTWVDSQGGYIALTGGLEGHDFVLRTTGTTPDGKPVVRRMVFTDVKPDSFEWRWESSTDGGKTWTVVWPIHYQRRKTPTGP